MITRFNLLYSVAAVRRMLGLADDVAVQIREFFKVIWVWVKGKRPTFISKYAFKVHFVDRRKAAARALTVTPNLFLSHIFTVRNETKATTYKVNVQIGGILCECDDFSNQAQFFGKACCKHAYAVLNHLGFASLADYIAA
jgi:SWIM zinc finger